MTWLVYGAYGYTGELVVEQALAAGQRPVLGGRRAEPLAALAARTGLRHVVADLDNPAALDRALEDVSVVAHCAGPFSATARPMVDACLRTGTHYLDITGEIDVFEAIWARHDDALAAGIVLLPGSGFDVVPSDCLAAELAGEVGPLSSVTLALRMGGGVSPGTARTAAEALGAPSRCRRGGAIVDVPASERRRHVVFADTDADVVAVSWGDVSSAARSTGAPDVTVYMALPAPLAGAASALGRSATTVPAPLAGAAAALGRSAMTRTSHLLGRASTKGLLAQAAKHLPGPSARARSSSQGQLWAEVVDTAGTVVTGTVTTPNGYSLTADAVVRIAVALEAGEVPPGALTPSQAFGARFARSLDGVEVHLHT